MPEMIPLGWFHTVMGIVAIGSGAVTLARFGEIGLQTRSGQIYLLATLVTAATALAIFQHGAFGPGHVLAILTILALATGTVAATTRVFGGFSRYLQAAAYSATLLFHSIPAVTDGLMRLPVGNPIVTSVADPLLLGCYAGLLLLFLAGVGLQLRWIYRQRRQDRVG